MVENYDFFVYLYVFSRIIDTMDSHEKLGNLLSQYLSSDGPEKVPSDVLNAFHLLGLTEFASRTNVESTYNEKMYILKKEVQDGSSRFSREFEAQQEKELSNAYARITEWFDSKA